MPSSPSKAQPSSMMGALQLYKDVLEPFTRNRKSTSAERATILELWSDVVRRCVSKRFVFFDAPATDGSPPDIVLAKSVRASMGGGPHVDHDRLLLCVQFLRFATLRKVVDHVIEPSAPALLSGSKKRHVLCSILYAAAEVSSLLPTEDVRVGGVRRGIPWGSLGEGFSSSDEDRDDGAPRPIESLFATASALIVAHWNLVCPLHWSGATPLHTFSDDDMPSRWSSRTTSPRSAADPVSSADYSSTTSGTTSPLLQPTFHDMSTFAECVKMLLLRSLWFRQDITLGATLSMTLCLIRSLMLYNKSRSVRTVPPESDHTTLSLFHSNEVREMVVALDFFCETFATKVDGDNIRHWAPRLQFTPGVRALHTSLLVRAMHAGVYQHRVSTASGFSKPALQPATAPDFSELCMSVSSRAPRVCTLQVFMEVFEWYLASGGPQCSTRYLHIFPAKYGEDSENSRSATESRIISVASLLSDEAKRRCVLVCEEFRERRRAAGAELFTESTGEFPHKAAVISSNIPLEGPHALRYDARKKIAAMLQSMCPDRYPIHESIILPEDVPEVEAIELDRTRHAIMETELLRVARLEVHERCEWKRVEAHGWDRLHDAWKENVDVIYASFLERLLVAEAAARRALEWSSMEIWIRAALELQQANSSRDIAACAKIEKMRCKVREREQSDHRRVVTLVTYLEATSRAELEAEENVGVVDMVTVQESAQRQHVAQQRLHDVSFSVGFEWLETQSMVNMLRVAHREASERNLMIRWMISSLSRSLQRQRPSTLANRHELRVYIETCLNPMLSAHCESANPHLTVGGVWGWYQARLNEAECFMKEEAVAREQIMIDVLDKFHGEIVVRVIPQLLIDVTVAEEAHQRRMLHHKESLGAVVLEEASGRLSLEVEERTQFSCSTSTPTAAYDAIIFFESLCSRLRALEDSAEPSRASSIAATQKLCWDRLMLEFHKSRRELYKRQRPSEAVYIGPERGLAPRPPTAQLHQRQIALTVSPKKTAPPPTHVECHSPELHTSVIAGQRAAVKSPASTVGSRGAASTTPGLTHDMLSALSGRISELDTSSITFLLDVNDTVTTRASSQLEGPVSNHHSRQCFTPQPPAALVDAPVMNQRRRTMSGATTTLLSSPSYRGVIDIPRRPTSAKPQAYKLASRTTVDPTSRSPLRYRADEDDSVSLIHKIVANAQSKH